MNDTNYKNFAWLREDKPNRTYEEDPEQQELTFDEQMKIHLYGRC